MASERHGYTCELDPDTGSTLKVYLVRGVRNSAAVRAGVVSGALPCAAVRPQLVLAPLQLAVAANRAELAHRTGSMVTRTVYAEIVYNLSLSKNISQSLSKFGIENPQDLLVCFLVTPERDDSAEILAMIEGDVCPISELTSITDMKALRSVYKLSDVINDDDMLDVIVSRMVTKNFVSH